MRDSSTMQLTSAVALIISVWMFSSWGWGITQAAEPSPGSSFEEWCQQKASFSDEDRKTVEVLLAQAGKTDCDPAAENLLSRTELDLYNNPITDVSPSPETSVNQQIAVASSNPISQQVSSPTKTNDTQNKITHTSNATAKINETQNQILLEAVQNQDFEGVKGHLEIAQILIEKGADVNIQDAEIGMTALMRAAGLGYIEILRLLLAHGADVSTESYYGDTALTIAQENGYRQIVELLKQAK